MRKLLAVILSLTFVLAAGFAAEGKGKRPDFSAHIIPTRAANIEDQFTGILPQRPPFFPTVSKVVCGEPFHVEVAFVGAAINSGVMSFAGTIVITDPTGKQDKIPLERELKGVRGDTSGVFLFPQTLVVIYEPKDPKGKYTFDLEFTDRNAGKTAKASASVEYVEKIEQKPGGKAFDKIGKYFKEPAPEYIVPAFREYLAQLPQQKAKEKQAFNPLPQLAIFYFLLRENPQVVPAFTELFRSLHNEEKYMAAVVLNFVSEKAAKALTPEQRGIIEQQFPKNPFVVEKAEDAWQLDVCWAEFLVRGTKAPVMKVVEAMGLANDALTIEKFKQIAEPTQEDKRKLMNGLMVRAAMWSCGSLAKTHPLVRFYVEAALVRGEIKDPLTAALAAKAIGMKVKTEKK